MERSEDASQDTVSRCTAHSRHVMCTTHQYTDSCRTTVVPSLRGGPRRGSCILCHLLDGVSVGRLSCSSFFLAAGASPALAISRLALKTRVFVDFERSSRPCSYHRLCLGYCDGAAAVRECLKMCKFAGNTSITLR